MSSTHSGTLKIIAYNIRFFRERMGATQEEIAEAAKISYRLYQSLESGRSNPTIESLTRLAIFFKAPSHKLLKLSYARLNGPESEFIEKFKKTFQSFHRIAVIRNLEGSVLWSNPTVFRYLQIPPSEFPLFSAVYSTAAGEDSEEDYSNYCDLLLSCF